MMKRLKEILSLAAVFSLFFMGGCHMSDRNYDVPEVLPRPDSAAPSDGKVKVYILAGQSNMVGFGYIKGAQPVYPDIYLSADPSIKTGRMPLGNGGLLPHGVYLSGKKRAARGANVAVYKGAYREGQDYSKLDPILETTVALGTVNENLPSVPGEYTVVADACIDVPMDGNYEIHVGYGSSTCAVAQLDGVEVYRKEEGKSAEVNAVRLEAGKRYPLSIKYMKGGSAALWLKNINIKGKGDLESVLAQGKYPCLIDKEGNWTVRNDVTYREVRISQDEYGTGGPLSTVSNGNYIGCEVPFGYVMGTYHKEPVLLIESSMGNRSLSFDFLPPSSGKTEDQKKNKWCGLEYDLMVKGVHKTLDNIEKFVPGYKGQGYEIAGFVWWQGHKDKDVPKEVYEKHLVHLINDVKKEFNAPDMKTVVATVGFHGKEMPEGHKMTWEAQMAVGDPRQHPEFSGKVATVDIRDFWHSRGESPTGADYHYNHNAETYLLTGDAIGRAMVRLQGGTAAEMKLPRKKAVDKNVEILYSDSVTLRYNKTGYHYPLSYYSGMRDALKPIVVDDMIPSFLEKSPALEKIVKGERPDREPLDITNELDVLMGYYDLAGITDYDWKPFGPEMRNAEWYYYSFDPKEKQAPDKSDRYRKITFPAGMSHWYASGFQPLKAGWKQGKAPFGQIDGKLDRIRTRCTGTRCGCCEKPATLWEKEVLLVRQTFDMPPLEKGHVYRMILGGAGCDRSGEGFAIYVNGKLLTQQNGGFFKNPGVRGSYIYKDILPEFEGGKVTVAVISFLRYTYFRDKNTYFGPDPSYKTVPPHGQLSVWMEQAEIPPVLQKD